MDGDSFEPLIVGFCCNWCSYAAADLAGTSRMKYPPNLRMIRVMCSGRVSELFILKAFTVGADGVLVAGCHPGDCHYLKGNLGPKFAETVESFTQSIRELGPSPLNRGRNGH